MKKIILFIFVSSIIPAQVGSVRYNHPVYDFLRRMETDNVIENYDPLNLPKTRNEITSYLKVIITKKESLPPIDQSLLDDFITEFYYDLYGNTENYTSLLSHPGIGDILSEKEKFLFFYTDSNKVNLFGNLIGEANFLYSKNNETNQTANSSIFIFGGSVQGSLFDRLGFYLWGTNGTFTGDRSLALQQSNLSYNYKINQESPSDLGDNYFDETEGYIMAEWDFLKLKLGSDRKSIGYGLNKEFISDNAPRMDYLSLNINYSILNFSFFHGKLLGIPEVKYDSLQGSMNIVQEKYIGYHRLSINFSDHLKLGIGEMILYGNRGPDFAYLNPFNFYKSSEHANQDRDNSILFVDFLNNSVKGLQIYGSLFIDDIDFGKLGTDWYGNQTMWKIGIYSTLLYDFVPLEFELQYLRIDPYVYTHRFQTNSFTSLGYSIGAPIQPNSGTFSGALTYLPYYRLKLTLGLNYTEHGANLIDEVNNTVVNYGGDISLGHRPFDSERAGFLEGNMEILRSVYLLAVYEPVNNYFLKFNLTYSSQNLSNSIFMSNMMSNLTFYVSI